MAVDSGIPEYWVVDCTAEFPDLGLTTTEIFA